MGINSWPPARFPWDVPSADPADPPAYRLTRRLGRGAQGEVYEAQDAGRRGQRLAIKFIHDAFLSLTGDAIQAFKDEAEWGLQHRSEFLGHGYKVLDLRRYARGGWPPVALVMEYFPTTLDRVLEVYRPGGRKLPVATVQGWLQGLAEGLDILARDGLVHRDLNPRNCGVRARTPDALDGAKLVLFDFGTVCRAGTRGVIGVLQDDPPEGCSPPWWIDPATPWKDPFFFAPPGDDGHARPPFHPAADVYSFGRLAEVLAEVVDGPREWLDDVARLCRKAPAGDQMDALCGRPRPAELIPRLRPESHERTTRGMSAGYSATQHTGFVGRRHVFDAFDEFAAACDEKGLGGVFLVVGPSGIGKTALLTNWVTRLGMSPCFFFQFRKKSREDAMPRHIYDWLAHEFGLPDMPANHVWQTSDLEDAFREVGPKLGRGRLVIFIDALDEAEDPGEAVKYIPKSGLPRGLFLVVSSRPTARRRDHLRDFGQEARDGEGLKAFSLQPEGEHNREDVRRFFRDRLRGRDLADVQIEALVDASGGLFRLAGLLLTSVNNPRVGLEKTLESAQKWATLPTADKTFAYYQDDLDRTLSGELLALLPDFARLLVAGLDWFSEADALGILQYYEGQVKKPRTQLWSDYALEEIGTALTWLLNKRTREWDGGRANCFQLQHASVRDFLTSVEVRGPARTGVAEMNSAIGRYFCEQAGEKDGWRAVGRYGRFYAVRHLLESNSRADTEQAVRLLTDLDYLQATLGDVPPDSAEN